MSGLWRPQTTGWARRPPEDQIARDHFLLRTELQAHVGSCVSQAPADRSTPVDMALATAARPSVVCYSRPIPDRVYADFGDVWNAARSTAESGAWRRTARAEGGRG